jgi:hypothetical protein
MLKNETVHENLRLCEAKKLAFCKFFASFYLLRHENLRIVKQKAWQVFASFLQVFCKFFASFLQVFCKFFASFLQVFCKFFASFLQVFSTQT